MSLKSIIRPNIYDLEPYRCARDDYSDGILLDANENTHGPSIPGLTQQEQQQELNRYPDPHQVKLKQLIANFRGGNLTPENLFLGVGSDEAIDAIIRTVCTPGKEKLLICPPTYGMYSVSAHINDAELVTVELDLETFDLRADAILKALNADSSIKLVYICSPGNPTGKLVSEKSILRILDEWKNGIVVVDEAYIDFCATTEEKYKGGFRVCKPTTPSMSPLVNKYKRLAVLQTFSKSFGLAGLRLGMCFAHPDFARVLNAMKAPYNISTTTADLAIRALQPDSIDRMWEYVFEIKEQRSILINKLSKCGRIIGGQNANFVMVQTQKDGKSSNERAQAIYNELAEERGIVVRFRGKELGCAGCLRISVGTAEENEKVVREITEIVKRLA